MCPNLQNTSISKLNRPSYTHMPIHVHIYDWNLTLEGTIAFSTVIVWNGVHQGSVLGLLPSSCTIVWWHTAPTPLAKFADDNCLRPHCQQQKVRTLTSSCQNNSLQLNINKTKEQVETTPLSINSRKVEKTELEQLQVPGSLHDWEPDLDSDKHHHKNTDLQLHHCLVQQMLRPRQEVSTEHHQNRASIQVGTLRPELQEGGQLD